MTAEDAIRQLLAERAAGKTICPSEAARLLAPEAWREQLDIVREAAAKMVERGELVVTQRGETVDIATAKGPIRLRLP